ncbi:MAG: IPT/TIG domain-containing protein, partial [Patescibacteria group bacterium]|nr:IPT/TIG domain-containing protein [Patescibacteria group bacterium]
MKSTYSKKAQNGSVTVKAVEIIAAIIVIAGGVYLISTHSSKSAPTTDSNGNPIPVLNSVNPSSASIGTLVTVNGSGLAGFEGDKNLWITDGSGNTAIIHGDANSSATQISFTLADQYCTADTSYSGMDCPSYENIVPGTYTLTAKPWGTESNSLQLTVVGSQTVSTSTNSAFNWSIYSDSSHGFSFKYPSNFTLTSSTT